MEFFNHASWVLSMDELEFIGFLAWRLWHDRNSLVHENNRLNAQQSFAVVESQYEEYKAVMESRGHGAKEKQKKSKPPSRGVLNLNIDGAFVPDHRVGGAGVVPLNDRKEIAVARAILLSDVTTYS